MRRIFLRLADHYRNGPENFRADYGPGQRDPYVVVGIDLEYKTNGGVRRHIYIVDMGENGNGRRDNQNDSRFARMDVLGKVIGKGNESDRAVEHAVEDSPGLGGEVWIQDGKIQTEIDKYEAHETEKDGEVNRSPGTVRNRQRVHAYGRDEKAEGNRADAERGYV